MLLRGDFVHFPKLDSMEIFHDHLLGKTSTNSSGYIYYFYSARTNQSQALLDDTYEPVITVPQGSFFVPTFCDLHLHAPQFLYQGTGLHLPLMKWLDEYAFKAEERIDGEPELARRVYKRLAERLVQNGTGAVLLFGTIKEETNIILAEAMQNAGLRGLVGKLSMDISTRPTYTEHTSAEAIVAASSFLDRMAALTADLPPHMRLVEPVLTPRFVPTCSDALLHGLGELAARTGVRVQSHLAEARDEVDWVRSERGVDDIDVFDKAKLLGERTIQAHCTFLSPTDLARLSARGTALAHCPLSNAYFSAQPLRLREALRRGVRVGLGSDVAGGYSADVMSAMRWAVGVSRMREGVRTEQTRTKEQQGEEVWDGGGRRGVRGAEEVEVDEEVKIDWREAMYMATRGGAEALGLDCGVFKVGAPFDAQCIHLFDPLAGRGVGALDFFDIESGGARELSGEMVEKWWCLGDTRNRVGVWVQGRKIGP